MQRIVGRVKGRAPSLCPLVRVPYSPNLPCLPCLPCPPCSFGASGSTYTNSPECFCVRLHSTRTLTARPTVSRRRRPNTTYVELLEGISIIFYALTSITCFCVLRLCICFDLFLSHNEAFPIS